MKMIKIRNGIDNKKTLYDGMKPKVAKQPWHQINDYSDERKYEKKKKKEKTK